ARSSCPFLDGGPAVGPGSGLLELRGKPEQRRLVAEPRRELDADRHTVTIPEERHRLAVGLGRVPPVEEGGALGESHPGVLGQEIVQEEGHTRGPSEPATGASARARSYIAVTTAFSFGFSRSMRAMAVSTSSMGLTDFSRTSSAWAVASSRQRSVTLTSRGDDS